MLSPPQPPPMGLQFPWPSPPTQCRIFKIKICSMDMTKKKTWNVKVWTFWETHKIWKNLPRGFDKSADLLSKRQNHEEDFFKLCVLLKKFELYIQIKIWSNIGFGRIILWTKLCIFYKAVNTVFFLSCLSFNPCLDFKNPESWFSGSSGKI